MESEEWVLLVSVPPATRLLLYRSMAAVASMPSRAWMSVSTSRYPEECRHTLWTCAVRGTYVILADGFCTLMIWQT